MITTIELSEYDAELFTDFIKHQDLWRVLVSHGILDLCNGSLTLNFGHDGQMMIEKKTLTKAGKLRYN